MTNLRLPVVGGAFRATTRRSGLELAAVGDDDRLGGRAGPRADGLDLLDDVHALGHGAEDDVLAVEPVGLDRAEEEPAWCVPSAPRFSMIDTR